MRIVVFLILVAACDLQPPPPKQKAAASGSAPEPAPTVDALTAAPPPPLPPREEIVDAGVEDAAVAVVPVDALEPSQQCLDIGVHVAQLEIDLERDPRGKAKRVQDQANYVRRVAMACMTRAWSDAVKACYEKARTRDDLRSCIKLAGGPAGTLKPGNKPDPTN